MDTTDIIFGRQPVLAALESSRSINKIVIASGVKGKEIDDIVAAAKMKKIPFSFIDRRDVERTAPNTQGVVAYVSPKQYVTLEDLVAGCDMQQHPVVCVLDGITDPHNVGAIARSVYAFGAQGIILPKRHACGVTSVVVKASAGAIELLPVALVTNTARTLEYLKEKGFWVIGADAHGTSCATFDFARPIALVLGSEGDGLHRVVREQCDDVVAIPLKAQMHSVDSLNVSCAASVLLYQISVVSRQ